MPNTSTLSDARPRVVSMSIGLSAKSRSQVAISLGSILGDTFRLLVKTQVHHWNVVGPMFEPLHKLTESHYENLFAACDVIAERIRALGHPAPMPLLTRGGDVGDLPMLSTAHLVEDLVADHETLVRAMRKAAEDADEAGDPVSHDLIVQRMAFHEKAIWMLRAMLAH